ncbi:MAG TPA: tetratricopeptide repeat protein, partial [Bacteroidales bacterium]
LAFILQIAAMAAESNEALFNKGNEAYKKGKYDTALIFYKAIDSLGYKSSELFYNMGNVFYKKKDIAHAILYYERAHKLSPSDEDITFNLQLAQALAVDKINTLPEFFVSRWWRNFSELASTDAWAIWSIVTFCISLFCVLLYLFVNILFVKKTAFTCGIILFLFSGIAFSHSLHTKRLIEGQQQAIVMSETVTVRSSPDKESTELFVIHEGTKVIIIDQVGEWLRIKIADGNNGWMLASNVEKI